MEKITILCKEATEKIGKHDNVISFRSEEIYTENEHFTFSGHIYLDDTKKICGIPIAKELKEKNRHMHIDKLCDNFLSSIKFNLIFTEGLWQQMVKQTAIDRDNWKKRCLSFEKAEKKAVTELNNWKSRYEKTIRKGVIKDTVEVAKVTSGKKA